MEKQGRKYPSDNSGTLPIDLNFRLLEHRSTNASDCVNYHAINLIVRVFRWSHLGKRLELQRWAEALSLWYIYMARNEVEDSIRQMNYSKLLHRPDIFRFVISVRLNKQVSYNDAFKCYFSMPRMTDIEKTLLHQRTVLLAFSPSRYVKCDENSVTSVFFWNSKKFHEAN